MADQDKDLGIDIDAISDELVGQLAPQETSIEEPVDEAPPSEETTPPVARSLDKSGKGPARVPALGVDKTEDLQPTQPAASSTVPGFDMARPPDTWGKEAQATWATLPPSAQQAIAKRESDIAKFVSDSQPSLNVAQGVEKLLSPYAELFTRMNINPWQHMATLLHAHTQLVFGQPEVKAQMFRQLAQDAGIDLTKLANGQGPADAANAQYVRGLQEKIALLERGVTSVNDRFNGIQLADLESRVAQFAADTENHPYFDEVAADIHQIIQQGQAKSLQEAYDLAVIRNPQTRAKFIEAERQASQASAEKAAATKAAASRKAMAGRVRASAHGRTATSMVGLDDFLRGTLNEIQSRNQ